jgi:hypothetical protein
MYAKGFKILLFLLLFLCVKSHGQTFTYSYVDPCTGHTKSLQVPTNGITVTYYTQIHTFQPTDFYNGEFESWAQGVYQSYGGNNPCSSIIGLPTAIDISQSTALNFLTIINSISAASDARESLYGGGTTDILSGINSLNKAESKKKSTDPKKEAKQISNAKSQLEDGTLDAKSIQSIKTSLIGNLSSNDQPSNGQSNGDQSNGQTNKSGQVNGDQTNNTTPNSQTNNTTPNSGTSNGQTNDQSSNSQSNGQTNGGTSNSQSNGQTNGGASNSQSNGQTNGGTSNGQTNGGTSNGQTNGGTSNGQSNGGTSNSGTSNSGTSNGQTNSSTGQTNNGTSNNQSNNSQSNDQSSISSSNSNQNSSSNQSNVNGSGSNSGKINSTGNQEAPNQDGSVATADKQQKNTNLLGSTIDIVKNSPNKKEGNKPVVIASSDFVGFNFVGSDVKFGGKGTGSYTSMKWDGSSVHGFIADYTTAIKGPNFAGFYARMGKKRIDLISTSLTLSFDTKISIYGTFAAGQMWTLTKPKNLKLIYLATASYGQVYGTKFVGTAAIAGGMYDWKVNKRFDVRMMGLYVYAPYVSYYNDILLKSPHVVLPILGTNINITKRFRLNINGGGAWAIKERTINYTVMMGTRLML